MKVEKCIIEQEYTVTLDEFLHQLYIIINNDFEGSVTLENSGIKLKLPNNEVFLVSVKKEPN